MLQSHKPVSTQFLLLLLDTHNLLHSRQFCVCALQQPCYYTCICMRWACFLPALLNQNLPVPAVSCPALLCHLMCTTVFFTYTAMGPTQGFFWMGVMVIGMTALYMTVYFPMWGGMFAAGKPGVTEEDYYVSEYTAEERAQGLHNNSLKFAHESKSERGWSLSGNKNVNAIPAGKVHVSAGTV